MGIRSWLWRGGEGSTGTDFAKCKGLGVILIKLIKGRHYESRGRGRWWWGPWWIESVSGGGKGHPRPELASETRAVPPRVLRRQNGIVMDEDRHCHHL